MQQQQQQKKTTTTTPPAAAKKQKPHPSTQSVPTGLPRVTTPEYDLVLPVSRKKIKYRPFLVKEEKVLLMALEGNDEQEMVSAIRQILSACVTGGDKNVVIDDLPLVDVEFLFMNTRAKSVGEVITLTFKCQKCEGDVPVKVNLNEVGVTFHDDHTTEIEVTPGFNIILKYPRISMAYSFMGGTGNEVDSIYKMIAACIDSICQGETVYSTEDYTDEQIMDFLENLPTAALRDINFRFLQRMPALEHTVDITCEECKEHRQETVQGIANFFG